MILKGDQPAGLVDRTLHRMESAGAIEVVRHIVFAAPLESYRRPDALRHGGRFTHWVVDQTATKTAPGSCLVDHDPSPVDAEDVRHVRDAPAPARSLGGRP